jgi:uncharacterized metal-binding protein
MMDCTRCKTKKCRKTQTCNAISFSPEEILAEYHQTENQRIVQAAASLVDNGRAGSLSRIQELIEYANALKICKIGIAYCYGMENEAKAIAEIIRKHNIKVYPVSCTSGGMSQQDINEESSIDKVSCNPIAQASQINAEQVDLTVTIGLCLGHDVLFNRHIKGDVTTLVIKDRVYNNNPLLELKTN